MSLKGVYISTFTARCWTNFGIRSCMKCKSYFSKWKIAEYVWWSLRIYIAHKMSRRKVVKLLKLLEAQNLAPRAMLLSTSNVPNFTKPLTFLFLPQLWVTSPSERLNDPFCRDKFSNSPLGWLIHLLEKAWSGVEAPESLRGWSWVLQKARDYWSEAILLSPFKVSLGTWAFLILKVNISAS